MACWALVLEGLKSMTTRSPKGIFTIGWGGGETGVSLFLRLGGKGFLLS